MTLIGLQNAMPGGGSPSDVAALELLAHYELTNTTTGDGRSGFALLLELDELQLLLEMDVPIEVGGELKLNFFLPDSRADAGRAKVSIGCTIVQCRDSEHLHYGARVSRIGDASKRAIRKLRAEIGSEARA